MVVINSGFNASPTTRETSSFQDLARCLQSMLVTHERTPKAVPKFKAYVAIQSVELDLTNEEHVKLAKKYIAESKGRSEEDLPEVFGNLFADKVTNFFPIEECCDQEPEPRRDLGCISIADKHPTIEDLTDMQELDM